MKLGVLTPFGGASTPELIALAGRAAEERGLHSIWVPEHVVLFEEYASRYPYSDDGRLPGGGGGGVLEPFAALSYLAAVTQRVRLGTGICLVPQRNPVYTAKQVADVDFLSGGRVDFGVGIGWLREEFEALDVPWERRAARTSEYLGVMKSLWCDERSSYDGELYTLRECVQNPKPIQKPHPPIYFGGESDAALRRVAALGQGWFGFNLAPEDLPERLARLDALLAEHGRSRDDVAIFVSPYRRPLAADAVARYADLGVEQLILPGFGRNPDEITKRFDDIASLGG
jgi:probable F420-dependent oxidoreductase